MVRWRRRKRVPSEAIQGKPAGSVVTECTTVQPRARKLHAHEASAPSAFARPVRRVGPLCGVSSDALWLEVLRTAAADDFPPKEIE
jgi:hypothetical protein